MTACVYTYDDLQRLLALPSAGAARIKLRRLIADHKFPKPLPGSPGLFPRFAVDEWLQDKGCLPPPDQPAATASANTITQLRQHLEEQYASP